MEAGGFDVLRTIADSGAVAKATLLVLAGMSVATWATWGHRRLALARLVRESREARASLRHVRGLADVEERARYFPDGPLRRLWLAVEAERERLAQAGATWTSPAHADAVRSVLSRTASCARASEVLRARRGFTMLATVAATAPFVGLFGTVWGIVEAFAGIARQGGAGLEVVAPGIAEALVATGAGLVAAVPAVWAYNALGRWARSLAAELDAFAADLLNAHDREIARG